MKPTTQPIVLPSIPAEERTSAARRAETLNLPAVPGHRPPRKPRQPLHRGRKTTDTRANPPNPFLHPGPGAP